MRKVVLRQKTKRQEFEFEPLKVSKNGEEEDLTQMPHGGSASFARLSSQQRSLKIHSVGEFISRVCRLHVHNIFHIC